MAGHSHWAGIKHKKALIDNKRGKLWSKLSKAIIVAAKMGGGDPDQNPRLRLAVADAKAGRMPKDTIERAIKKGTGELAGGNLEEIVYEGYGAGGVAIYCEVLTDNRNRTAPEIRKIFEMGDGKLGATGCVAWMFERKGMSREVRKPIQKILPKLKEGTDLHPGVMGITLKSKDQFGAPPVVAAAQAGSPAAEAGLKSGDKIVEVGGKPVKNQAQLKHQIGSLYAGDTVQLAVLRGDKRQEFEFQLTDKLPPYAHPFLGILPRRDAGDDKGIVVRYVYSGSGAKKAGVEAGDRITKLGDKKIDSLDDAYEALATMAPDQQTQLALARGDKAESVEVKLGRLPTEVPAELPAAHEPREPAEAEDVGTIEIKLPEFKNECFAYVPENYDPEIGCGVVVWLPAPGKLQKDKLIERWKPLCEAHDLILLVPQSREDDKWQRDEVEFVGSALAKLLQDYTIDGYRSVVHGYQAGGAMAFLVMAAHHAQLHGLAVVDAAMPAAMRAPPLNPTSRVAVYWAYSPEASAARRIEAKIQELRKVNYPVTERQLDGEGRYLNDAELDELVRWIDSLDRI